MKQLARSAIRSMMFRAPWGVREAFFQACVDRIGPDEVYSRFMDKLKIVEVSATGDRGVVTSLRDDRVVLPEYAKHGTFAETVTSAFVAFFAAGGGTYIDVGANIGLMTIPIARNPRVRCLAFEPEPRNFDLLKRNVSRNAGQASVEFHQVALFHTRGSMSLAIDDANIGDHRLTLGGVPGRRSVEIPAVPLDDFLDRIDGPLAIKVDTQGAEPSVIAGGRQVIARAGLLAMEFCPYLMHQLGGDPNIVIDMLASFDRVAIMAGGIAEAPRYLRPDEAQAALRNKLATATDSDGDYVDILAARDVHA